MTYPEINDRTAGLCALILILLILFFLRPESRSPTILGETCDKPFFVQIAGEINLPGVYTLCHRANLIELINRTEGFRFCDDSAEAFEDSTFPSGTRIIIQRNDVGCMFSQDEMSAFYKLTHGCRTHGTLSGKAAVIWKGVALSLWRSAFPFSQ